jgi:hypothetical protein
MKKVELKAEIERLKSINAECTKEIRTLLSDGKEFDKLMIKCKYDNLELFEKSFWLGDVTNSNCDGLLPIIHFTVKKK